MKLSVLTAGLLAALWWAAEPAHAAAEGNETFGSVFLLVFLGYCLLVGVCHAIEFIRLRRHFRDNKKEEVGEEVY